LFIAAALSLSGRNLEVFFIDVEGGKATLIISPLGESLLIDAGLDGFNNRDADRIAEAAKLGGVTRIDNLVITHYHMDHVGGVRQLAAKLPIPNFFDHGPTVDDGERGKRLYRTYEQIASRARRVRVQPGETIPVKGLGVSVVSAGGAVLASPMAGAGQPNSDCARVHRDYSGSENAQSVGLLVSYGDFRLLDLGDLTGDTERQLVCPVNKIGTVTVFVVSHHGNDDANSPCLVHAIHPRVAIMGNGALHGGAPRTVETLRKTPGLEDIWQLHYSFLATMHHNAPLPFIANRDQNCTGRWLKLTVQNDGSFTVYNSGSSFQKTYSPK
jgi:beta-lactamase superfamily II metal-dependent hydrolase